MNNLVCLIGRLTSNPELRETSNNKKMTEISIAVNNGKDDTSFIKVSVFNAMAETLTKYCNKGDLIGVSGIIKNNNWEDKEGKKHYGYIIIANKMTFLSQTKQVEKKPVETEEKTSFTAEEIDNEDLPF